MGINLDAIAGAQRTAQSALSLGVGLVVPQTDVGYVAQLASVANPASQALANAVPGQAFFFDFEGEQTVELDCDITDYTAEDNTMLQSQIALRPELVTTKGFVGEVNDVIPFTGGAYGRAAQTVISKLSLLADLAPSVAATALIAYNQAIQVAQAAQLAVQAGKNAISTISGQGAQNKQQQAYTKFKNWRAQRKLFTVQTPWEVYHDMAILRMRVTQDGVTGMVTTFDLTFKQMRFAKTYFLTSLLLADGRSGDASSAVVPNGNQVLSTGPSVDTALTGSGLA